jgi:hypothetical protein
MNEKLKQVAITANPSSEQIYSVAESWPYNCAAWSGEELHELVRLVVRDCIKVVSTTNIASCGATTYDMSIAQCAQEKIINGIKSHFDYIKLNRFPDEGV